MSEPESVAPENSTTAQEKSPKAQEYYKSRNFVEKVCREPKILKNVACDIVSPSMKLMDILNTEEYQEIVSWLPHGNGFVSAHFLLCARVLRSCM